MENYRARVTVSESDRVEIVPTPQDRTRFGSVDELVEDVGRDGYYGGLRLLTATVRRFAQHCSHNGVEIASHGFTIRYDTDIPRGVGLGGSSAIVAASITALVELYGVEIDAAALPSLILSVETEELGISAGLQDRVAQVYGGLTYMDFDPRSVGDAGGRYESLDAAHLPPLFVAHLAGAAEPSEIFHSDLRQRFDSGDRRVIEGMAELAVLATAARDAVEARDAVALGRAMDGSFDVRRSIAALDPRHVRMVERAREAGAAANYAGSGGAIVGIVENDDQFADLHEALRAEGCVVARCQPAGPAGLEG